MKKIVYLLLLGLAGCQQEGVITEVPKDDWSVVANTAGQVKGQVNIKFKELPEDLQIVTTRSGVDTDNGQLNFVIRQLGGTRLERVFPHAGKFEARTRKAGLHLWYQVSFDENIPTAEAMKALSELPNVSIVEPIYKGKTESVSLPYNDPYLPRQWHLYNDGSNGMLAGADISILDAWEIEKGKPEVIVNVVDSKVDLNHEDLRDNLWKNPGEFNQNPWGDNDGNGYQGDWHGIGANPVTGVAEDDHGTHVAGILAAKNNNGVGICGVAGGDTPDNGVRFMCCPFNNGNPAASIKYGADHGAVICTNSWFIAGGSVAEVMQDAVNYFVKNAGIDENGNQTGPMAVLYSVLPVMTESSRRATILLRWIMLSQSQPSTLPLRKAIIPIMQSGSILQHPEAETDMAGRCGAVPETITTWNWWELRRQHLWLREWQP